VQECQHEERRQLTAVGRLGRLSSEHRIERVDLVDRFRWLDLVRAVPLVPPGLAVVQRYRSARPPQARLTRQGSRSPKLLMPGPAAIRALICREERVG
jgi:hypothetical protein